MKEVVLKGRLGTHPQSYITQGGKNLITFPLAVNSSSQKWHQIVVYDEGRFENIIQTLQKGKYVEIRGKLKEGEWADKKGCPRRKYFVAIEGNEDEIYIRSRPSLPSYYF